MHEKPTAAHLNIPSRADKPLHILMPDKLMPRVMRCEDLKKMARPAAIKSGRLDSLRQRTYYRAEGGGGARPKSINRILQEQA